MIDTVKEFADIAFEEISFCTIFPVKFSQESADAILREMCTLANSTGSIIINQLSIQKRSQNLITKAMLNYPIPIMQAWITRSFGSCTMKL